MTRSTKSFGTSVLLVLPLLLASPAVAHPGHETGFAFHDGFLHPFMGPDHLLAMVAVGFWAVLIGGRAMLLLPATFVTAMAAGALAAIAGLWTDGSEFLITCSVIVFGLALALRVKPGFALAMGVVALFAFAHGLAHGAEMPLAANPAGYVAGFLSATALLHFSGVGLGMLIAGREAATRAVGGLIALAGLVLAVS